MPKSGIQQCYSFFQPKIGKNGQFQPQHWQRALEEISVDQIPDFSENRWAEI